MAVKRGLRFVVLIQEDWKSKNLWMQLQKQLTLLSCIKPINIGVDLAEVSRIKPQCEISVLLTKLD